MVGRDRSVALAEQLLLIPAGSSAIVGLVALVGVVGLLFVSGRRARLPNVLWAQSVPTDPERSGVPGWRRPPLAVMFAAALLIALAEIGGAAMGRFKPEIEGFAIARAQERPELHGLTGTPDVDGEILDGVSVKVDGALRLFHLHGGGVGLMVFAGSLVVATFAHSVPLRGALYALLTVGGLGFPFGYLAWSILIPFLAIDAARAEAIGWVLVPFGALLLVALWVLPFVLARNLLARGRPAPDIVKPPRRRPRTGGA